MPVLSHRPRVHQTRAQLPQHSHSLLLGEPWIIGIPHGSNSVTQPVFWNMPFLVAATVRIVSPCSSRGIPWFAIEATRNLISVAIVIMVGVPINSKLWIRAAVMNSPVCPEVNFDRSRALLLVEENVRPPSGQDIIQPLEETPMPASLISIFRPHELKFGPFAHFSGLALLSRVQDH